MKLFKAIFIFINEIKRINNICNYYPISWHQIADAVESAIPLIEDFGPDGLLIAVQNEKLRHVMYDKI